MMFVVVWGLLLGCAGFTQGGIIPSYNVSFTNHHNLTNRWQVQINIDHEDGQAWDMLFAHSRNSTVAKLAPFTTEENEIAGSKKCPPPGYEVLAGVGYYKMYGKNEKKSWQDAEDLCELEGGHLIIIDSEQKLLYMKVVAFKYPKEVNFYVGIHDRFKEGEFVTIFNKTMKSTRYSTWFPGEPNGGTKENCTFFYYDVNTHSNGLLDCSCADARGFVCEIEIK